MAAATHNAKAQVPQGRQQGTRRVELHYRIDLNTIGDGTGLVAGEDAEFAVLPAGYTHERIDPILRTAEGVAATVDVGTEADPDCFLDGGNANGTINAAILLAGTEAAKPGTYYHVATPIRVMCPAAAATLDDAIIDLTFVGYMTDTQLEK